MKLALKLSFFLFALFIMGDDSFSLTEYQMKKICKKEKRKLICLKDLQMKKTNLQKGNLIEIPVIPYRK